VGKPFIDWKSYGPDWNQGFPDYSTAGSCGPTSDEDVNLKGYPTQPVVDLFNRGFALHWGVEPRDVWDLVVYALDYISLTQKREKNKLLVTYSKKDLIVMDLFAMLKIRVHSDGEPDAEDYDGVAELKCTGNTKDVLQQKAAHVETLYTSWKALKDKCAGKYVVKGRLALPEVQASVKKIGGTDAEETKKRITVVGKTLTTTQDGVTKANFVDNFASDMVYEHCLKVQLDYIRVLEKHDKLGDGAGDCGDHDGTYSCDKTDTFGQLLAWCASFSNEPYYSRGAVLHVVGTMQIKRKWQGSFAEQPGLLLQTFTEHYGDVLKEIKHVNLEDIPAKITEAGLPGSLTSTATYEHVSKSAKYLHRMADAAVRLWAALSHVPGGSKADTVCTDDNYNAETDLPLLNVARAVTGRKTLDGITDLKATSASSEDWCNDALENRAFWYVVANPRFDKLFNINVHKKGKYLDVILKKLKKGDVKFNLDLDRDDNPITGTATVTCAKETTYETCGETLLKAIVTEKGADDCAEKHLEPKVHLASTAVDGKRTAGAEFPSPISDASPTSDAFKAAITKLIVTDKAFSDQNFKEKLREYFIKLQRQARSELEPRTTPDPTWTDHCEMVKHALESPEWTVAETGTDGAGIGRIQIVDGAYMPGAFKFQDLLEAGKGVPDACK
jgi:hypothetical protein